MLFIVQCINSLSQHGPVKVTLDISESPIDFSMGLPEISRVTRQVRQQYTHNFISYIINWSSHEHHGIRNHWELSCVIFVCVFFFSNHLYIKALHYCICGRIHWWLVDSSQKRAGNVENVSKSLIHHDVIMTPYRTTNNSIAIHLHNFQWHSPDHDIIVYCTMPYMTRQLLVSTW